MINYFKNRQALELVKTSMSFWLGFQHEDFIEASWKVYPSIKSAALAQLKGGEESQLIGAHILLIVFTDLIEKTQDEQRKKILDYLLGNNIDETRTNLASKIEIFLSLLYRQTDIGRFPKHEYEMALEHIIGACSGKDFEEAYKDRIRNVIHKALLEHKIA